MDHQKRRLEAPACEVSAFINWLENLPEGSPEFASLTKDEILQVFRHGDSKCKLLADHAIFESSADGDAISMVPIKLSKKDTLSRCRYAQLNEDGTLLAAGWEP